MNFSNTSSTTLDYTGASTSPDNESNWYYGDTWRDMRAQYIFFHGYLSLVICIFGSLSNVINIIVLSKKSMISPLNTLLTGLAVADMLVMLTVLFISIMCYETFTKCNQAQESYVLAVTNLIFNDASFVFHTISVWLTVTIAIWRLIAISMPLKSRSLCTIKKAKLALLLVYVSCVLFCVPVYVTYSVVPNTLNGNEAYSTELSNIGRKNNGILKKVTFWLIAIVGRLIPCVALTGLSVELLRSLYVAKNYRKFLKENVQGNDAHNRVTKLLLAILFIFLITETPSGILALLTGVLNEAFSKNVYSNFSEILDMLALINSAANFIVYCAISRQFRKTLSELFIFRTLSVQKLTSQNESTVTDVTKL